MLFFDTQYLILVLLPAVVLSAIAQLFVRNAFNKWSKIRNTADLNGVQVAGKIMRSSGLQVDLEGVAGKMSDHYDPRSHTVRMSADVANRSSVASMAIIAHELGHAQQHQDGSVLIGLRNFLVPAVQVSPMLSYGLIVAGFIFNVTGLLWLGILFFAVSFLFMLITLPVEIDASRRGLKLLEESGLMMVDDDRNGSRQVLTAAALTYVAAAVTSLLTLLYYISLAQGRD